MSSVPLHWRAFSEKSSQCPSREESQHCLIVCIRTMKLYRVPSSKTELGLIIYRWTPTLGPFPLNFWQMSFASTFGMVNVFGNPQVNALVCTSTYVASPSPCSTSSLSIKRTRAAPGDSGCDVLPVAVLCCDIDFWSKWFCAGCGLSNQPVIHFSKSITELHRQFRIMPAPNFPS